MEHINPDILEIIVRHLQQQTSQPEEKQLAVWLEADPQNKASFEEVSAIWAKTGSVAMDFTPDTQSAWQKVKSRTIDLEKPSVKTGRQVALPNWTWKIAASVALITGIGFWFLWKPEPATVWTTVSATSAKRMVVFPDSSTVWLNKNSYVSYSDFQHETREVKLDGEAFFEVKRNPEKPFRITGHQSLTEILGTSFNLVSRTGAADKVEVVTGLVAFSSIQHPEVKLQLKPGKRGEVDDKLVARETEIANPNFRSWQTGQLRFNNTGMDDVASALESYFGVVVQIQDSALTHCRFTGSFDKPEIQQVLDVLSLSVGLEAKEKEGSYLLYGKGCP